MAAGTFDEIKDIQSEKHCVLACCQKDECNVAFMTAEKCYHITCASNELCMPVLSPKVATRNQFAMVLVRAVGDDNWENLLSKRDQIENAYPEGMQLGASSLAASKSCNVGIPDCGDNEECVQNSPKSRAGTCRCKEHYIRNSDGICTQSATTEATSAVASSTQITKRKLKVAVENAEIQLPQSEVNLKAFATPEPQENEKYNYDWTSLNQPEGSSAIKKQNGDELQLTKLSEGLYTFKVNVSSEFSYGETFVNVTVLAQARINQPPKIVITPANQTIKLPTTEAVLDASPSTDDNGIVSYHWELQQGPVGYQPHFSELSMLALKDLTKPGNYTFKLTVTDTDKATSTATANITVLQETDYPPEANAGPDVIVYLPHKDLQLNATMSSDDHNITTWEWTKIDTNLAVDMQDTRTPILKLSNLEEGMYTFQLKVTDSAGQSSTAKVHVFVKPPTNQPPVAKAGDNITISLPQTWVVVNGNQSTDDNKIVDFKWSQVEGPSTAVFTTQNASVTNVTSLTKGNYVFKITVTDDNGNSASALQYVTVDQNKNQKPIAKAGDDFEVVLPQTVIYMNGSQSSDDWAIVKWKWARAENSLAYGQIGERSEDTPVLILTDVVPGRYIFNLTVYDEQGLSDTDSVTVTVRADPNLYFLVEMIINADIKQLTHTQYENMKGKLALLVQDQTKLQVQELSSEVGTERVIIQFYIEQSDGKSMDANMVVKHFREKLKVDADILGFSVSGLQTVICQNNCSGHGLCDERTRICKCDTFWMRDMLKEYWDADDDSDCSWSILYVVLGVLCFTLTVAGAIWGLIYLCLNNCSCRSEANKPTSYKLIENTDDVRKVDISDTDSDSDVVFESRNKSRYSGESRNGHKRNGFVKMGRRIKT